jgi:broad specificity phosphatase PhoE
MQNMKTLYLIRHGEADYNLLDRVNAHPQVTNSLTVTGRAQAACCAREIATAGIERIYCSEFPRAQQTADIVNQALGVAIVRDARLNETGAFAFEGQPCRRWHAANVPDRLTAIIPGCEPFSAMKARLAALLDALRDTPQTRIALVSHEEPIQILAGLLQGLDDATARQRPISHCLPLILPYPIE